MLIGRRRQFIWRIWIFNIFFGLGSNNKKIKIFENSQNDLKFLHCFKKYLMHLLMKFLKA